MGLTQVDTDGIKDDAVTLDKRAGVARGKLIVGDASGNPTALAKGSAGQVLKHDGNDIAWGAVPSTGIAADAIDGTKIADDSIDSEHIVDGSIDHEHLAGDAIDGDNIQDDVINSEHIAAGAIDLEHMSSESVDEDNLHISNAGTNGQFLQKSSNSGGLTWATVDVPKLAAPTLTGPTGILTSGTATLTISNYSSDCSYTFASLTNCTIGTVNASGEFVVTNTGSHNSSFTIKSTTTSLGLADSDTTAKSFTPSLSAPTINSPADAAANTNVVYTVTSTTGDDDKIILDMGSSNFTYGSVSHGSGSKVGNTVEVTGFTTNNPSITLQLTTVGNYSVKAKSVDTGGTFADSAYSATDTITCLNAYNVSFYVQGAGGGGAVTGGGGGAGGHRSSWNSETSGGGGSAESPIQMVVGTQYTCTIGGGGSGGSGWGSNGSNGQNSSITVTSGGADVITSTGGGYGSHGSTGGSGGCGGGSGYGQTSNGGSGTANQGYDGGSGSGTHGKPGGGGGGCSGAGGNAHGGQGGSGGYGRESTISGSAVTIGGGGGSGSRGSNSPGSGRNGGGHGKTCGNCSGGSGDTNSGSGGGSAGGDWSSGSGGTGGSGIIYLRMATSDYSGTTTNSPNVTTDGSDTIIKFTGTGTYTA